MNGGERHSLARRLQQENAELRATVEAVRECAADFAALPLVDWNGRMVADTFLAALDVGRRRALGPVVETGEQR